MPKAGLGSRIAGQVGVYVGQVLRGATPSHVPVDLRTANALGLTVPPTLPVAAADVIE